MSHHSDSCKTLVASLPKNFKMIEKLLKQTEEIIKLNSTKEFENLLSILRFSNIAEKEHEIFNNLILEKACVNLHFHPDRILNNNCTIVDSLIESGEYKNQYQTKISSGSLTAVIGEERDVWENKLFNNIYGSNMNDRPKYGSLSLNSTSDGASPRFGSCFFVTTPEIKYRSTFTYGDSYLLPNEIGTANHLTLIYAKLYEDIFIRNTALGFQYNNLRDFIKHITKILKQGELTEKNTHNLDFYIEAQIHGRIDLKNDITTFVADYSFKETEFESRFKELCKKFDISLVWNLGYKLLINDIPDNFRGIETQNFAKKIAENGIINAYIIGKALTNEKLKAKYEKLEIFQLAKYVWHCLVKFGHPIKPATNKVSTKAMLNDLD
jgi:hypothetical protein